MLSVQAIDAAYGDSQVLFGMSFEIAAGEFVTLLGRNGMGKTTTVRSIMGILPIRAGEILFEEQPIHNLPSFRVAKAGIGLVPEGRQVFPNLSVRENLIATATQPRAGVHGWTIDRVVDLFPALAARFSSMGNQLSGGEQQMLAIGRALMTNPRLLILDEATEGLAPMVRTEIWHCLESLKEEAQAVLVIDKNVDALTRIADRHYIVEKGAVVWAGTSEGETRLRTRPSICRRSRRVQRSTLTGPRIRLCRSPMAIWQTSSFAWWVGCPAGRTPCRANRPPSIRTGACTCLAWSASWLVKPLRLPTAIRCFTTSRPCPPRTVFSTSASRGRV